MSNDYFISIEEIASTTPNTSLTIRGRFKVPYRQHGITEQDAQVLKHIILVVSRGERYHAAAAYKDVIVFKDDVKDDGVTASAVFNLHVAKHINFNEGGDYYILCSLGTFLSNIVTITIP